MSFSDFLCCFWHWTCFFCPCATMKRKCSVVLSNSDDKTTDDTLLICISQFWLILFFEDFFWPRHRTFLDWHANVLNDSSKHRTFFCQHTLRSNIFESFWLLEKIFFGAWKHILPKGTNANFLLCWPSTAHMQFQIAPNNAVWCRLWKCRIRSATTWSSGSRPVFAAVWPWGSNASFCWQHMQESALACTIAMAMKGNRARCLVTATASCVHCRGLR